ncbi:8592_t:CDS:2, partial [Scutellospora calospora]
QYNLNDYTFKYPVSWISKNDLHSVKGFENDFVRWGKEMKFINNDKEEMTIREMSLDKYVDDLDVEGCDDILLSEKKFSKLFTTRGRYDEKLLDEYDGAFNDPKVLIKDIKDMNDPICIAWLQLCDELENERSKEFVKRLMNEMKFWIFASLKEKNAVIDYRNTKKHISFHDYMEIRKYGIGMIPTSSLIENIIDYEIDPDFFKHPSMKRICYISCIIFTLTNDSFSFWKDIENEWVNSIVAISQEKNISYEEASKKIVDYHNEIVKEFDTIVETLDVSDDIKKYIQHLRVVLRGFAEFGLRSKRYIKDRDINVKNFDNPKNKSYYLRIEYIQDKRKHVIEKYHKKKENLEKILEEYKSDFKKYNDGIDENKKKKKEIEKMLLIQNNSFIVDYDILKRLKDIDKRKKQLKYMFTEELSKENQNYIDTYVSKREDIDTNDQLFVRELIWNKGNNIFRYSSMIKLIDVYHIYRYLFRDVHATRIFINLLYDNNEKIYLYLNDLITKKDGGSIVCDLNSDMFIQYYFDNDFSIFPLNCIRENCKIDNNDGNITVYCGSLWDLLNAYKHDIYEESDIPYSWNDHVPYAIFESREKYYRESSDYNRYCEYYEKIYHSVLEIMDNSILDTDKVVKTLGISKNLENMIDEFWTDGSYFNYEIKRSSIRVFFGNNDPRNLSERLHKDHNDANRAEICAVIWALEICEDIKTLEVITDSGCVMGIVTGRDKKCKKHIELKRRLKFLINNRKGVIKFTEVKSFSVYGNKQADRLAKNGAYKNFEG